ncbi:MAG: hypothetical protein V1749_00225 [Candidatus Desantisbacteria bacterium]
METKTNIKLFDLFDGAVLKPHKKVDPCFMTGKGCVYTDLIDETLKDRRIREEFLGFSVFPFRPNLSVFFKNCLYNYFRTNFKGKVGLQKADEVRRPGIIICEGICKRIQESDFVTVDISLSNPNVFYELGLSYGISHKLSVIHHHESLFGKTIATKLEDIGCKAFSYHDLDPIRIEDYNETKRIWQDNRIHNELATNNPKILLYEHYIADNEREVFDTIKSDEITQENSKNDINLNFDAHVKSAVGIAIQEFTNDFSECQGSANVIATYLDTIKGFKDVVTVKTNGSYKEIRDQVDSAYCMIIRTGFSKCHPMSYFWLGYGHAKGKNVIPVTVISARDEKIEDLAFDIRAQRHMVFIKNTPERFEEELKSSLSHMIHFDFSEWSRKHFWDKMIGRRGEVSIFTGALHNEEYGREMIGDWDLRTAAEITSYFARAQYRAKIENPVYTPEYPGGKNKNFDKKSYMNNLRGMLTDKNCILIASSDVNPLTEIVLGHMYKVPEESLFQTSDDIQKYPNAIVAVKERKTKGKIDENRVNITPQRFFYQEIPTENEVTKRGFMSAQIKQLKFVKEYMSQTDEEKDAFELLGHLAITKNPFTSPGSPAKFIITLNGVSGPATFALTHILTGGVTKEFVSYEKSFAADKESETILKEILDKMKIEEFDSLDCLITVKVGRSISDDNTLRTSTTDWRKIISWKLDDEARTPSIKTGL